MSGSRGQRRWPPAAFLPERITVELQALVQHIAERIGQLRERRGLIERDAESAWLSADAAQGVSLNDLIGHSITDRIAVGPRAWHKGFTLQTGPAQGEGAGRSAWR